jgi:hypothetical protein
MGYTRAVYVLFRVVVLEDIQKGTIMSLEDNKAIARRYIEECVMQGNTHELRNEVKESRQMRNSFQSRRGPQARANRSERFTRR